MGLPVDPRFCYLIEPFGTTASRNIPHTGDDWARRKVNGKAIAEAPDVYAVFSGTVVYSAWHGVAGNRIIIRYWHGLHGDYGHLKSLGVKPGQTVKEGQYIGLLGGTGKVTGPHLHYTQSTDLNRLLKGVYPYWKNPTTGRVLWPSVDAWAATCGLRRPQYAITTDKAATPATPAPPSEEDDMPLTPQQAAALDWLGSEDRRKALDLAAYQTGELHARRGLIDQLSGIAAAVNAPQPKVDAGAIVDELVARIGTDAARQVADQITARITN